MHLSGLATLAPPVTPLDPSWVSALWFLVAIALLDYFDISLPRGDSTGVAGALRASALVVLGPLSAITISLAASIVAHLVRRRGEAPQRLVIVLLSQALALGMTSILLWVPLVESSRAIEFVVIPAVALILDLLVAQVFASFVTGRPVVRLIRGNADSQAPLMAAQWSAAVLLLLTYGHMGRWGLIPVVALLILMRQSYALFLDVRETYRATVEVLVEAAESQDVRRAGHAERTSVLARSIAMKMGLPAAEVERISYASLLHDLGELAEGPDLESGEARHAPAADVVRGVEFFDRVEPILRVCDGAHGQGPVSESDVLAALIVALASDIDAEYHPQVAAAHVHSLLDVVAHQVSPSLKARAVGAALRLGYRIPAVG